MSLKPAVRLLWQRWHKCSETASFRSQPDPGPALLLWYPSLMAASSFVTTSRRSVKYSSSMDISCIKWISSSSGWVEYNLSDSPCLAKGCWQVLLAPSPQPKTAFSTTSGNWQYQILPFGLHWVAGTFQWLMDIVLRGQHLYAAAYLYYVIIHSTTWQDHLHHLRNISKELRKADSCQTHAKLR